MKETGISEKLAEKAFQVSPSQRSLKNTQGKRYYVFFKTNIAWLPSRIGNKRLFGGKEDKACHERKMAQDFCYGQGAAGCV